MQSGDCAFLIQHSSFSIQHSAFMEWPGVPLVYFISHPEVVVRPEVPMTSWDLSEVGLARWERLLRQQWVSSVGAVWSSRETKATTAAERLARVRGLPVNYLPELGEMDRSATGCITDPGEFNRVVDAFFAKPDKSIRGWERAADAYRRIVAAVDRAICESPAGAQIAIVSHGGVGALLKCHLKRVPVSRAEDQPG